MKTNLPSILALGAVVSIVAPAIAQTIWVPGGTATGVGNNTTNGNVGVGTATPAQKLEIHAGNILLDHGYGMQVRDNAGAVNGYIFYDDRLVLMNARSSGGIHFFTGGGSAGNERLTITSAGDVGIGVTNPGGPLHVRGSSQYNGTIRADGPTGGYSSLGLYENGSYQASMYWYPPAQAAVFYGPAKWVFESGNVGIGTFSPSHKLAVNGTIRAKEVLVETTGWSDHVFADDYRLAPLEEVEAHIRAKKHLPGIPSAATVA
ncbi:MAG TPA: hypothetical protein VEB66_12500, partial [Opitutaceae bacterium]|nr:hypothetical protein [Opitutaceae bacterium]